MKRTAIIIFLMFLLTASAAGQARINTKRVRIRDFTTRTTKVVLGSNPMLDAAMQEDIAARWSISPFEFCDAEEFNALKENSGYYFLMLTQSDGIQSLTLFKGGKESTPDHTGETFDVVSVPLCSSGWSQGREFALLPALIDLIQDFVRSAMISDKVGYGGIGTCSLGLGKADGKQVYFDPEDLVGVNETTLERFLGGNLKMSEDADEVFTEGTPDSLVGFVIAPSSPVRGQICTKMLIDASTHELYWYGRHRISERKPAGFLPGDIKKFHSAIR